jgi:hypothetical protein
MRDMSLAPLDMRYARRDMRKGRGIVSCDANNV